MTRGPRPPVICGENGGHHMIINARCRITSILRAIAGECNIDPAGLTATACPSPGTRPLRGHGASWCSSWAAGQPGDLQRTASSGSLGPRGSSSHSTLPGACTWPRTTIMCASEVNRWRYMWFQEMIRCKYLPGPLLHQVQRSVRPAAAERGHLPRGGALGWRLLPGLHHHLGGRGHRGGGQQLLWQVDRERQCWLNNIYSLQILRNEADTAAQQHHLSDGVH